MSSLFLPGGCNSYMWESADDPAAVAYRGLVKMHAQELVDSERYRRAGRITPNDVHAIARDLDKLDRKHDLDTTIELVLAEADARDLQREADAEFRERQRQARGDEARDAELRARRRR